MTWRISTTTDPIPGQDTAKPNQSQFARILSVIDEPDQGAISLRIPCLEEDADARHPLHERFPPAAGPGRSRPPRLPGRRRAGTPGAGIRVRGHLPAECRLITGDSTFLWRLA